MGDRKPRDEDLYFELIEQGKVDPLRRLVADRPELLDARPFVEMLPTPDRGRCARSAFSHAASEDLALDDLVRGLAADHSRAGKFLPARRTAQVSAGPVLGNPVHEALDQRAGAALAVLVEQRAAAQAVDRDRSAFGHRR